jgi:hypothetical protein
VPELPDVEVFRRTLTRTSLHRKVNGSGCANSASSAT